MPSTNDATPPEGTPDPREPRATTGAAAGFRLQALGIATVALAVRAIHLAQLSSSPYFGWLVGDPERYHAWAAAIAGGDWLGGEGVFFQAPLYPYFLAVVYRLLGADPAWARLAQIALGVASCVLLAAATRRIAGARAGLVAGLLLALYPPALFFEVVLQKSALDVFLLALLLLLVARAWEGGGVAAWLAAGVAGGALVLTRENALVLLVGLGVWLLADGSRGAFAHRARATAVLAIGVALVVAPVALRNRIVGGELVVTSSQLGRNLYYGNGPDAKGTYAPLVWGRGGIRWEDADARRIAEESVGRPLGAREVSAYWTRRTIEHVRAHPGAWARLVLRKMRWTVASQELMDTEDQSTYRDWAPVARVLGWVLPFGVVFPLAVLGAFALRRFPSPRLAGLLALWIALYAASVVAFFVLDRYRMPLAVLLLPFAAAGVAGARSWLGSTSAPRRVAAATVVATAALVSNWPIRPVEPMKAQSYNNLGAALAQDPENLGRAAAALELALRYRPGFASAHHNLGIVQERARRPEEAVASFERALELGPETALVRRHLGYNLAALGRWNEATVAYERAVELEPDDVGTVVRLGIVRAEADDLAGAVEAFERALALDPGNPSARENLERARGLLGEVGALSTADD